MPNEKKGRKLHDVNEISKTSSEENNFVENEENEANNLENSEEIALVAPRPLSPVLQECNVNNFDTRFL